MKIRCPHCDAQLKVRDELQGKRGRCPRCGKELCVEPNLSADPAPSHQPSGKAHDPSNPERERGDSSSDEFAGVEPLRLVASSRSLKQKKSESIGTGDAESDDPVATPKRRRRMPRSTLGMLAGVVNGRFWRSARQHLPYLAAALACVGALLGFLVGLVQNALVAGLLFDIIGLPTALLVFFMMSYPTSCFFKVVAGSADSSGDIDEWPESNYGEWVFEMLFVGYMIGISILLSAGVGKLRQLTALDHVPSENYWQLIGGPSEGATVAIVGKLLGRAEPAAEAAVVESASGPGPGWKTTFIAFLVVFPLVMISCLDLKTPLFVPWAPRVLFSLLKNFTAWLVVFVISGALFGVAAGILVLGARYAPFWTFTLASPLAALGLLLYGRLLGRLSWLIART